LTYAQYRVRAVRPDELFKAFYYAVVDNRELFFYQLH